MKRVFADAFYWIALVNHKDPWHKKVLAVSQQLGRSAEFITTEEVLDEFLTCLSKSGEGVRRFCAERVRQWLNSADTFVLPQTHDSFLAGLNLYEARPNKEYSLTDCISMVTMRQQGITEVLTCDAQFEQEGFTLLL